MTPEGRIVEPLSTEAIGFVVAAICVAFALELGRWAWRTWGNG